MSALKKSKINPGSARKQLLDLIAKQHEKHGHDNIEYGIATVCRYVKADPDMLFVLVNDFYRASIPAEHVADTPQVMPPVGMPPVGKVYRQPRTDPKSFANNKAKIASLVDSVLVLTGKSLGRMTLGELKEYAARAKAEGSFYSALYEKITGRFANVTSDMLVRDILDDADLKALAKEHSFTLV